MRIKPDLVTGLVIFIIACSIFLASHLRQIADSKYSLLVSESLLHHGSFALDGYVFPGLNTERQAAQGFGGIYQLELREGHIYYYFPPGSSILSIPYVAVWNALGVSAVNADGT